MFDAFLSYSRKDEAFAIRLRQALADAGKTLWLDKRDILPAEDWRSAAFAGIDSANNFLFVISPDSVRPRADGSPAPCGEEIARAVASGKRLIPIHCVTTPHATIAKEVRDLNDIDFRAALTDDDAFAAAFQTLICAMETDLAWIAQHTQLHGRATDWQSKSKDSSTLLRGDQLRSAEAWLAQPQSPDQRVRPTPPQIDYITASRTAETRSQRLRLRIAAAVAGLSITLAAIALFMFFRARTARHVAIIARIEAERQRDSATAGALAANAVNLRETQLDLASLLALEATRLADTFDTRNALIAVTQSVPALHAYLHGLEADGFTNSIAFSSDGKFYATGSDTGVLHLRDAATHRILFTHTEPKSYIEKLAFNPFGTLAVLGISGKLDLWQLSGTTLIPRPSSFTSLPDQPKGLAWSPDGAAVAVSGSSGTRLWEAATGKVLRSWPSVPMVWSIAFDPANPDLLASVDAAGQVLLRNVRSGATVGGTPPLSPAPDGTVALAFSPDGTALAVAPQGSVHLWNVSPSGQLSSARSTELGDNGFVMGLAFSPDSAILAAASSHGTLRQWNVSSLVITSEAPRSLALDLHSIAFSPTGATLLSGLDDGTLLAWDRHPSLTRTLPAPTSPKPKPMRTVLFSPDGHLVAGLDLLGGVTVWNLSTNSRTQVLPQQLRQPNLPSISFAGKLLLVSENASTRAWDTASQSFNTPIAPVLQPASVAALSQAGLLAINASNGLQLFDLRHLDQPVQLPSNPGNTKVLAFNSDGKLLASAGDDENSLRLWEVSSTTPRLIALDGPAQWCASLAFSFSGDQLACSGYNGLALWNTRTGKRSGPNLLQNRKTIEAAAFSPDRRRLAIAIYGGAVQLADAATLRFLGSPLQPDLQQQGDGPSGVAYSPDGKLLAFGSDDNQMTLWDADPNDWRKRACQVANRNLTPAEWTRYIGPTIPYHRTCPTP